VYGAWARREFALMGELTEKRRRTNIPAPEPDLTQTVQRH
jgi:hypothetical protein